MKLVIKIVLLFILAIFIAIMSGYGNGHVVLFMSKYRLDLSLSTLLLIVLIIYVILHYAAAFLSSIYNIPDGVRRYRRNIAINRNRNYFNLATNSYFQEEYQKAYNNALKSLSQDVPAENKLPVLLLAVDAINLMNEDEKKISAKLDRLVAKFTTNKERSYIFNELTRINKTKNDKLYTEILTKLGY
jgi:HemY protein